MDMNKDYNIVILEYASGTVIFDNVPSEFYEEVGGVERWLYEEQNYREDEIHYMVGDLRTILN